MFNLFVEVKRNGHVAGGAVQAENGEWFFIAVSDKDDTMGHDFTIEGDIGAVVTATVLEGVTDDYEFELRDDSLKFLDDDFVKLTEL